MDPSRRRAVRKGEEEVTVVGLTWTETGVSWDGSPWRKESSVGSSCAGAAS